MLYFSQFILQNNQHEQGRISMTDRPLIKRTHVFHDFDMTYEEIKSTVTQLLKCFDHPVISVP